MSPSTEHSERREFATEMKFLVSPVQADAIQAWLGSRLDLDPHADRDGGYWVTSLYFDTPARDVYERNGSYGRSKYRVRRYGDAAEVFLERKMKRKDRVGKTRSLVAVEELPALDAAPRKAWDGYWFHRRLQARQLAPVCQISYRRSAWVRMTELGAIRVTVDSDLRAVAVNRCGFVAEAGTPVTDKRIVEIKFRRHLPLLFRELVRTFALTPRAVSKYRMAAATLGLIHPAGPKSALAPELILCKAS